MGFVVRDYRPADEVSWLRCRVLSFLRTPYYDDVLTARPPLPPPGFGLVAEGAQGAVVGCLDVSVEGALATIDTVAVHPDHQRWGIGRALLAEAAARAATAGASTLDAWTRDQPATLAWYRATGFAESDHYLHVYADDTHAADADDGAGAAELARAVERAGAGLRPVRVFAHAPLAREAELRAAFRRVYVCRRFSQPLAPPAG
ncbi:GNAT family N-acetyltransferase [Streptomyces sp. DSM 44915]|uniref:GNAT family N-acetyltransferase n=1 Tax=Streptomyces chisholmiae TaxID=3075540 RepID=A0ABU2JQ73_9ACTN|nr:GNAT family N-acetyltransferase [Streptomyces sp. DSM 44915]MDT0266363.1 GNAT family N-acetyltransferase [Streptomyces sp. DSM 44915]